MEDEFLGTKKVAEKWGFGMAPPKAKVQSARIYGCEKLLTLLEVGRVPEPEKNNLEPISIVKSLFNRAVRADQWDWFTVCAQLGYPSRRIARVIANELSCLRSSIKDGDITQFNNARIALRRLPTRRCLSIFLGRAQIASDPNAGWIYVLSTREFKELLKIGMTTRSVELRVQEINRATGVAIPFGVRRCWHVRNPKLIEKLAHQALASFRFREDREFFRVRFHTAVETLNSVVADSECEIKTLDAISGR